MNLTKYRSITWVLVVCFSSTMLTGCQTFELEIVEPTEPAKLATPLINSITINVATKLGEGGPHNANMLYEEYAPQLIQQFLIAMKQRLVDSGAAVTVRFSAECKPVLHERTLCITETIFNQTSFLNTMKLFVAITVSILGLGIPLLFVTIDYSDMVIAEAILLDKVGKQLARFQVQSEFSFTTGLSMTNPHIVSYIKNNEELANRTVLELTRHPHWFQPSPD